MDPMQPCDELPLLPASVETPTVLRAVATAARALAALDQAAQRLPDPTLLIHAIPLQEAQASSAIENIVTTSDALYRAAASEREPDDSATREALRYRTALRQASVRGTIDRETLQTVCSIILDEPARFRSGGDFVHLRNASGAVVYTPPANAIILPRLLDNLLAYIHEGPEDPLLRMAVAHYQFEAIHPFTDGNGRTGRILNLLILQQTGLLRLPILYLSKYIIERKDEYYDLLANVTFQGAWDEWLLWLLSGVEETSRAALERIDRIDALQKETHARLQADPRLLPLVPLLFKRPYCKVAMVVDAGLAKRQTAADYLHRLEEMGILASERIGRERLYRFPALIRALA